MIGNWLVMLELDKGSTSDSMNGIEAFGSLGSCAYPLRMGAVADLSDAKICQD
jgi:hypothetical protein